MDANLEKRKNLLRKIQELEFTALDLNLYMDTHPTEQKPLERFNKMACELSKLKKEYDECYGPLLNFGFSENKGNYWRWVQDPWPWDL